MAVFTLANYGFDDYVYMTTNALDSVPTFTNVQGNLPKVPVYSCLVEMHDKNKVLVGTDNGIYSTDNVGSATWTADNAGMGTVPVFGLKQQTIFYPTTNINNNGKLFYYPGVQNYGAIYAASYGNGFFIDTTYYNPMGIEPVNGNLISKNSILVFPNPVKNSATVSYTLSLKSDVSLMVYDISGRIVRTITSNGVSSGNHQVTVDLTGQLPGIYMIRLDSKDGSAFGKLVKTN
jgi:hypothetical protein